VWLLVLGWYTPALVVSLLYIRDTIHFSYIDYTCDYDYFSPSVPTWYIWYFLISLVVVGFLSCTTLLVTSVLLLIVASRAASRHGETLRWEGVITVLLTVGVFFLSYLPYSVAMWAMYQGVIYGTTSMRAIVHLTNLNIMANFFVYSLTVRSFKHFLKTKISEVLSFMSMRLSTEEQRRPHRRPVALQRQRPHPRQDPREVLGDDALTPAAELQGLQLQEEEMEQNLQDIVAETPV